MLVLETPRLKLRPLVARDASAFLPLFNDWAVARMVAGLPFPCTHDEALAWLRRRHDDQGFAIEHDGAVVGAVTYYDTGQRQAEIGFIVAREQWGNGYATEATARVIAHGFSADGIEEFRSAHALDNAASRRVLTKLGFVEFERRMVWSNAREREVPSQSYRLPRPRAATLIESVRAGLLPRQVRRRVWRLGAV